MAPFVYYEAADCKKRKTIRRQKQLYVVLLKENGVGGNKLAIIMLLVSFGLTFSLWFSFLRSHKTDVLLMLYRRNKSFLCGGK